MASSPGCTGATGSVGRPTTRVTPDAAELLRGLHALGYHGLAQAIGHAQQATGLPPQELARRLALPVDALELWAKGSFIPALSICCAWARWPPTTSPTSRPGQRQPPSHLPTRTELPASP
jgi:hypothetical protein